ncbi:hypothetical protein FOXB_04044 [Fusarium oxysporum f. sp. conglutinans Fo5176]|uniref:Uncharacterized protein n=1 Tax=Fusarium oxysporum (strain Fo5176) TaxID=660025 RepID=F9FCB6_FUSOF|nr:hypothetical protein FOXB_04044 [Fusarium oxysporum f. sp. conglutinans Fo5176]
MTEQMAYCSLAAPVFDWHRHPRRDVVWQLVPFFGLAGRQVRAFSATQEYPGGNSQDYKQVPNSRKTYEIKAFPKLLREIKKLLGNKELSIAVPGLKRDMVAYIPGEIPYINESVNFINIYPYPDYISWKAEDFC